jgi:hypothetical protein
MLMPSSEEGNIAYPKQFLHTLIDPTYRSILHFSPQSAIFCAIEYGVHNTVRPVTIFKRGEGWWMGIARTLARRDESVNIAHHIAKRVGPGFLMAAGQMCIRTGTGIHQRWILLKDLVWTIAPSNP